MEQMFEALKGERFEIKDDNPDNVATNFVKWLNVRPRLIDYSKIGNNSAEEEVPKNL